MKRKIDLVFLITLIAIIGIGLLKTIFNTMSINEIENRTAYSRPVFSLETYSDKSYQDQYEKAFADQLPYATKVKLLNNSMALSFKTKVLKSISNSNYIKLGNYYLYDNYLVSKSTSLDEYTKKLDKKIENFNKISEQLTDEELYIYYIDRDVDVNFETNKRLNSFEYIKQRISNKYKMKEFVINDFEDYKNYYFKTDHHWGYKGSYKGYTEIIDMLLGSSEGKLVEPKQEVCLSSVVDGSRGRDLGSIYFFKEPFCGYDYDIDLDIYINDKLVDYYGEYKRIIKEKPDRISYADWYGNDHAKILFDNKDDSKQNILMIGESYDNAVLELIATHFNKTYSVDLRHYSNKFNQPFDIVNFVKTNDIDKVLFIGTLGSFFANQDFMIETN